MALTRSQAGGLARMALTHSQAKFAAKLRVPVAEACPELDSGCGPVILSLSERKSAQLNGWEQHRRSPDAPARTVLGMVDADPAHADRRSTRRWR